MRVPALAFLLPALLLLWPQQAVAHSLRREKFTAWFTLSSAHTFAPISDGPCNQSLANYRSVFRQDTSLAVLGAACSLHQQCIISHLRTDVAARLQSANVLLGLTPVLLTQLGPSLAELSLLARERPLLAMLVALGSPSIFIERVFKYQSVQSASAGDHVDPIPFRGLKKYPVLMHMASALQYLLVMAAVANMFTMSFWLGMRTTLSFSCNNWYHELVWSAMPFFIYMIAAFDWRWLPIPCLTKKRHRYSVFLQKEWRPCLDHNPSPSPSQDQGQGQNPNQGLQREPPLWRQAGRWAAHSFRHIVSLLPFFHTAFGILLFSSLTFIELFDAFAVVMRYMASAIVCRAVLSIEVAGLRKERQTGPISESETTLDANDVTD